MPLFKLPLMPFLAPSSSSTTSSLPIQHPHRWELEASSAAAFTSPFSPARPAKPAFPAAGAPAPSFAAPRLPIFSLLILLFLPCPNAMTTPFDAAAAPCAPPGAPKPSSTTSADPVRAQAGPLCRHRPPRSARIRRRGEARRWWEGGRGGASVVDPAAREGRPKGRARAERVCERVGVDSEDRA
ncbi:hypothetical protein U9M48_028865 [Paspalum notatum var. saurae]|uniref:Uncharacterized protein n=1 Tax=Paspalum notatum var. saurae TaxID=547442 RepID=A0AAQ3TWB0_PASNO